MFECNNLYYRFSYLILEKIINLGLYKDIPNYKRIIGFYFVIFSLIKTFQSFANSLISLFFASTYFERIYRFQNLYFKGPGHNLGNPFHKVIYILELFSTNFL